MTYDHELHALQSRLLAAREHYVWVCDVLSREAEAMRNLAKQGNAYADGRIQGLESALCYLRVLHESLGITLSSNKEDAAPATSST